MPDHLHMDDIVLRHGPAMVSLRCNAGGRLVALRLADAQGLPHEVLCPYPAHGVVRAEWAKGGLFPLMPYSNRIVDGQLRFAGQTFALPPHPAVAPHTLHGNAHLQSWALQSQSDTSAAIVLDCVPSAHWPWRYLARLAFALHSPSELRIQVSLINTDHRPQPAGIGLHPYLLAKPDTLVTHDARQYWPCRNGVPQGLQPLPLRDLQDRPDTLHLSDWQGHACLALADGARVVLKGSEVFGHLVVHRPPHGGYLCVEPTSHVVNGFNLAQAGARDTGCRQLQPGAGLEGELVIALGS